MGQVLEERDAARWKASLQADPYRSYLYAYPHKTSYRPFDTPIALDELWRNEPAETFFLYMHIPFCGARCGFCNLFTLPDRSEERHARYLDAMKRQARQWAPYAGNKPYARFALGGGTPTLLRPALLDRVFAIAEDVMGLDTAKASISVETSPETVTRDRLQVLKDHRIDRISMGIQSFVGAEATAIYRPQQPEEAVRALELLREYAFPVLNLDLIYGLPGQTIESWLYSLRQALEYRPEELFLYPLYTRDHTIVKPADVHRERDERLAMYEAGRDLLRAEGYAQTSMRRFARAGGAAKSGKQVLPYSCQEEGMVGLGCGARSYTREVHYASRYAVSRVATAAILEDYMAAERYDLADYGIVLSGEEQRRRYVLKGILHAEGLSLRDYAARYPDQDALQDYPELTMLLGAQLAQIDARDVLRLTDEGMAYSDAIGDLLISDTVRARMEAYVIA